MEKKEDSKNDIFEFLFNLDVNSKVEKKGDLNYLSWSYAWGEVRKQYPSSIYEIERFGENRVPYLYDEDLGYMVFTRVNIDGEEHEMWLPVMDGANKAMLNHDYQYEVTKKTWNVNARKYDYTTETKTCKKATMFDINKTLMRCLVKNLAMFGLGLYIYSGEDLPDDIPEEKSNNKEEIKKATPNQVALLKKTYTGDNLTKLLKSNNLDQIEDISKDKATEIIQKIKEKQEAKEVK